MRRSIIGLTVFGALAVVGCSDSEVGGESVAAGSSDDFCAEFEELDERFSADPEAADDVSAVADALDGLNPPDEIADDFDVVVEATRELAELDPDDPDAAERAQELGQEAAAAQDRLSEYLESECGVDLGSPTG